MKIWIILKEIHLTGCIVSCFKEYEVHLKKTKKKQERLSV